MIGTVKHLMNSSDTLTTLMSFLILIYLIFLAILYIKTKDSKKGFKVWVILCFVPLLSALIHFAVFSFGSAVLHIWSYYKSIYIPSVLIAFLPLFAKKKMLYRIGSVLCVLICAVFAVLSLMLPKTANFADKSLSEAYISLCDYLEDNYVLSEWKKIDYEKLKAEGLVLVKEAEKTGDTDKYYEALNNLVKSFHDGHMGLSFYGTDYNYIEKKLKEFNDYGLSLVTLDDGDTIAIMAEDNLEIKNGDIITKWDGIPIDEAIESVSLPIGEGTSGNERIVKTFYLSGMGGDSVDVTYINSDGDEAAATLNKIDDNPTRALTAFSIFNRAKDTEYEYKMLDDNIGYLKVTKEETNEISDSIAYVTGNNTTAREMFREDLRELKSRGMTKLVIDLRNNAGGLEEVSTALTSLFTKDKMYAFSLGVKNGAECKSVEDRYVTGDGEFSDLDILVLTGMRCGSAGDGLVLYLSRLENVTVAGLSDPSGINQEAGGTVFMPENAIINFPTGLVLDENGDPNIDIDDTRQSRNPVDIKIPLDKESALKIFNGEDYELEWAIDHLRTH